MTAMATGFWVAMTPILWAVCAAVIETFSGDGSQRSIASSAACSLFLCVPLWWALYFAIGMLRESMG